MPIITLFVYHPIQKLLPEDIKVKRNKIYQEIGAIREEFGTGEIDDNTILQLKEKEKELNELERLYTPDGELKTGKEYEDALAIQKWKETKRILKDSLTTGDIVFFRSNLSPSGWHCGLYLGNGTFAHAANKKEGVKISSLSEPRYLRSYKGAGRFN